MALPCVPLQDEIFHVPQTQEYCIGHFSHWDPKITTFPGLYIAGVASAWAARAARVAIEALASGQAVSVDIPWVSKTWAWNLPITCRCLVGLLSVYLLIMPVCSALDVNVISRTQPVLRRHCAGSTSPFSLPAST